MQSTEQESLSVRIHEAGAALVEAARIHGSNVANNLNNTLNQFLSWPFKADRVYLADVEDTLKEFDSVIYLAPATPSERKVLDTGAIATVIHVVGALDHDQLREGYERIGLVKRLKKTRIEGVDYPLRDTPLGIIFAICSELPLEKIAEQMILVNSDYPVTEWPDMVVILTSGTINYGVQFYSEKNIRGDFYLPDPTALTAQPMYVHMIARGLGLFAMNKMCSFIFAHLSLFSPGSGLPNLEEVLDGVPRLVITINSYQFDLKGQLLPSRNLLWEQGKIGPLPFRIEDSKGNLLSHLEYIPWQDGGILHLTGKFPLEGILVFLGEVARNAQTINVEPDGVVSNVLPIHDAEFRQLLWRIQHQTNMTVKPETLSGIVISKWRDEGSASPAVARLMLGIQRLRDMVFTDEKRRKEFDVPYQFVLETIMNTRATAKQITQLVNEHSHKVSKGEIAQLVAGAIRLSEDINSDLQRLFAEFLNSAVRVAKDGMQNLLSLLGLNIGFLFQQQGTFEEGLRECARDHPELAAYLHETRKWSEPLILLRNNLHKGWMLPKMTYKQANVTVQAMEPQISGRAASDFVNYTADRLCCFVEEVLVHSLQAQMPSGLSITEIPISDRKVVSPERFQVTFVKGGMPIWTIAYHDSIFEET